MSIAEMLPSVFLTSSSVVKTYCYHFACSSIATRHVRSLAKRKKLTDSIRNLEGKVVTMPPEYRNVDYEFENMKRISDLKKVYNKVFVDTKGHEAEIEAAFLGHDEEVIEHVDKYHDMNEWEEKRRRSRIEKSIIQRKYFPNPEETNLLTYAAKWQIKYLHEQDKSEWTFQKLAECFPSATVNGIKRILKNGLLWTTEAIRGHDAEVERKWKLLESGENKDISPLTRKLYDEGKITRENYNGNPSFPLPPPPLKNRRDPNKLGEYMSIIKPYLDQKKKNEEKSVAIHNISENDTLAICPSNRNLTAYEYLGKDVTKAILPKLKHYYPSHRESEDPQCASFLTADPDKNDTDLPCSQFEENLRQEFSEKKKKDTIEAAYEEWLKNQAIRKLPSEENSSLPIDPKEIVENEFEVIRKFNRSNMNNQDGASPFYGKNLNSQHIPASEPIKKRIKIPKHLYKQGTLYRVGQCYYDEHGIFLYKVCM